MVCLECFGKDLEKVVVEGFGNAHKLLGVDGLFVEDFGHGAHVAR